MNQKSFTLIEILVVIVVIGIISSFIIVGLSSVSDKANIAKGQAFSNSLRNSLLMNLVSEWKIDSIVGSSPPYTTTDSWGNNTGTLMDTDNACSFTGTLRCPQLITSGCPSGNCLDFDGVDDYINIGNASSLTITDEITIEFWAYKKGSSSNGYCSETVSRRGCYDVCCEDLYTTFPGVEGTPMIADNSVPSLNRWYHLVYTYNSNNKIGKAYRDSLLVNTRDLIILYPTATSYKLGTTCSNLYISNSVYRWNGRLDEIRLYQQNLSDSQIQQNYFLGLNSLYKNRGIAENEYVERIAELKTNSYSAIN
jgi:prepilin-type N-terminal cleavage/methylation domain-containing protein